MSDLIRWFGSDDPIARRFVSIKDSIDNGVITGDDDARRGVYFLIANGDIQYVGQSGNIPRRVIEHRMTGRIPFDNYVSIQLDYGFRRSIEQYAIDKLRPPFNIAV